MPSFGMYCFNSQQISHFQHGNRPSKIAHMEQTLNKTISALTPSLDLHIPYCPVSVEWLLSLNDKNNNPHFYLEKFLRVQAFLKHSDLFSQKLKHYRGPAMIFPLTVTVTVTTPNI